MFSNRLKTVDLITALGTLAAAPYGPLVSFVARFASSGPVVGCSQMAEKGCFRRHISIRHVNIHTGDRRH